MTEGGDGVSWYRSSSILTFSVTALMKGVYPSRLRACIKVRSSWLSRSEREMIMSRYERKLDEEEGRAGRMASASSISFSPLPGSADTNRRTSTKNRIALID